jgi:hypothetical protein
MRRIRRDTRGVRITPVSIEGLRRLPLRLPLTTSVPVVIRFLPCRGYWRINFSGRALISSCFLGRGEFTLPRESKNCFLLVCYADDLNVFYDGKLRNYPE